MKRKVLHKSKKVEFPHMTLIGTLCNRNRNGFDGMNIADTDKEVTCKFCLKLMNAV